MAIGYDVYSIPHPRGEDEKEILHIRLTKADTVTVERMADEIEQLSSFTVGDVEGVIPLLVERMVNHLHLGHRVHIKGLGYFQLSIGAKEKIEDVRKVRSDQLKVQGIRFKPEKDLMVKFRHAEFSHRKNTIHSGSIPNEEVEKRLTAYFQERPYITREEFQNLCGFTKSMALAKLKVLIEAGKVKKMGRYNSSVYEPVG